MVSIRVWDLESFENVRTLKRDRPYERLDITGIRGLTEAVIASLRALGAIEGVAPYIEVYRSIQRDGGKVCLCNLVSLIG